MISGLVTAYNRQAHVCRAVESALAQSVPVDEIVIVDDGSTDGTDALIRSKYGDDPRVRYVKQENRGISGARRRVVDEARGDWVTFLDSDDEWPPDRNKIFLPFLRDLPEDVAWIFGDTEVRRDDGFSATVFDVYAKGIDRGPRVLEDPIGVQIPFQIGMLHSSYYRRSALLAVNCFSEMLNHSEDFLVGVQLACLYRVAIIPDIVTRFYRTSELKPSSQDLKYRKGADYHRARMLAYRLIIETGRKSPYTELYGESARALCQVLSAQGESVRSLVGEQFRYGVTAKSVLFAGAATLGRPGISSWMALTNGLRTAAALRKPAPAGEPPNLI